MFVLSRTATAARTALRSTLGAALLAGLALSATAQTVTINEMTARGDSLLNGVVSESLTDTGSGAAAFVDVLAFPFELGSGAGMHSYGSSDGVFGSRSSGFGVFDVTGSFFINLTITNNQATAQNAVFDFHITPGMLELTDLPYSGSQFVETGVGFNILTSNGKSFSSTAMLRADASGLVFNTSGDSSLYGGAGADRFIVGADRTLDLGVLGAGESVTLSYTLTSYAKGDALVSQTVVVPGRTVVIPGYWTSGCNLEIPQLTAVADGDVEQPLLEECSGEPVFVPPQEVTLPETTYNEGDSGGAQASSGDPFAFNLGPGQLALPPARNNQPFSVTLTGVAPNPVPEPGALSLVLLALAAAGTASRRKGA